MKINPLITSALMALGLITSAHATFTSVGGTNIVFMTGSTAFRGNIYNVMTNSTGAAGTFWDAGTVQFTSGATGASSSYWASGKISSVNYLISFDFTGSEAGICSVAGKVINQNLSANPALGLAAGSYVLPNATNNISFSTPYGTFVTQPDLSMADTSQAVSLTTTPALTEYGIVGVVAFEYCKGRDTSPGTDADTSWSDLSNVTIPQLQSQLSSSQNASFFTGNGNDGSIVKLVGRNKGSGTRVNNMLNLQKPIATTISQNCVTAQCSYGGGKLAIVNSLTQSVAFPAITSSSSLDGVGSDGFESGGGVSATLSCDTHGSGVITLGYLGINDANACINGAAASSSEAAQPSGAVALTLDGVACNDGNIELGTYTYWGHEHLYGQNGQSISSPPGVVASLLTGITSTPGPNSITDYQAVGTRSQGTAGTVGSIEAVGGLGGGTVSATDNGLDADFMLCDKSGDTGYPTQL